MVVTEQPRKITTQGPQIKKSSYKTPYHLKPWIDDQIKEMEEQGIIKESVSKWRFPLVIVKKKKIPEDYA
jgi:hypothetical protein